MIVFITLINVTLLGAIAFLWWKRIAAMKTVFVAGLSIKLLSGILVGILYTYYYTVGDTFGYFHDGVMLSDLARKDFSSYWQFIWNGDDTHPVWQELVLRQYRALFLTKLVSVVTLVTGANYWIASLYFSFLSFAASWSVVSTINKFFPKATFSAIIAFLFFPSVVFWSSGIIKESLAVASLCFLSMIFLRVWVKDKVHVIEWILALWAVWILWNLKYYFAAVFIPVVITSIVTGRWLVPMLKPKYAWLEYLIWLLAFVIPTGIASISHPNFNVGVFLEVIVSNNQAFQQISNPEDLIHFNNLTPDGWSMLINTPLALVSGLFRPFPWESGNIFQILVSIENVVMFVLFIMALGKIKKMNTSPNRLLFFSLIVYVLLACVFITLSTPNFGTLSRYRAGYIPFFALLIMIDNPLITRLEKFLQRFL